MYTGGGLGAKQQQGFGSSNGGFGSSSGLGASSGGFGAGGSKASSSFGSSPGFGSSGGMTKKSGGTPSFGSSSGFGSSTTKKSGGVSFGGGGAGFGASKGSSSFGSSSGFGGSGGMKGQSSFGSGGFGSQQGFGGGAASDFKQGFGQPGQQQQSMGSPQQGFGQQSSQLSTKVMMGRQGPPPPMIRPDASTVINPGRSLLSELLPDGTTNPQLKQRVGLGSDASLYSFSNRAPLRSDGSPMSNGQQQSSVLSSMLPQTQQYGTQPFSDTPQTSLLSYFLPETSRASAYAAKYNEPAIVGSDAALAPLAPNSRQYNERNMETLGPKTSPMLDWFAAPRTNPDISLTENSFSNQNTLSTLAMSQGGPTSRTNDGLGGFSKNNALGGSSAFGSSSSSLNTLTSGGGQSDTGYGSSVSSFGGMGNQGGK